MIRIVQKAMNDVFRPNFQIPGRCPVAATVPLLAGDFAVENDLHPIGSIDYCA